MYDRFKVLENDDAGFHCASWIVDVPLGQYLDPAQYLMSRKKGNGSESTGYYNMDSPTVRKSGKRRLAEQAVLWLYQNGTTTVMNGQIPRATVMSLGQVNRKPSAKRERSQAPLQPIGIFVESDKLLIDFILDQPCPIRYQVAVPRATSHDVSTYRLFIYRRLNPRAKSDPQYGMRAMSPGRSKADDSYDEASAGAILKNLQGLLDLVKHGTKARTTLEVLERQLRRLDGDYAANMEYAKGTASYRLRQGAQHVARTLFIVTASATPENIQAWETLKAHIMANRDALAPKFESYLLTLKAKVELSKPENRNLSIHGAQTPYNGTIPPMPTHLLTQQQNAPQVPETPANSTHALSAIAHLLNPSS